MRGDETRLKASGRKGSEAELSQAACEVKLVPTVVLAEEGPENASMPLVLRGRRLAAASRMSAPKPAWRGRDPYSEV